MTTRFDRRIQIMKKHVSRLALVWGAVLAAASLAGLQAPADAQALLGTAQSFAVLGGSTVTNTGPSIISGNLGVSPGSAVTGFPPGIVINGTIHAADAVALQAQSDVTTAYNALAGMACNVDLTGQDLGGLTLTPGVYCFSSSAQLTGELTLDAQGNPNALFVFQIGSTLTTASNSSVRLINGARACNVFWQVGSSATLGTATLFAGNILALASITLNTGASIVFGRALARTGAVTLDNNVISIAGCAAGSGGGGGGGGGGGSPTDAGSPCAILTDSSGTFIEVTDVGTAPKILCHGRQGDNELGGICDEAFSVCVKGAPDQFEIGVLGTTSFGLIPAPHGDPDNTLVESCEPFVQVLIKTKKGNEICTVPLVRTGFFPTVDGNGDPINVPVYDLSNQLLDLDCNPATAPTPLPKGVLVNLVIENRPRTDLGRCIGVRTTIQHKVGTCKIWKTRKFFNVCKATKTITSIKEFELPCGCGEASAVPSPSGSVANSRTAQFTVDSTGEYITLSAMGWSGASKVRAGSVGFPEFSFEFLNCMPRLSLINPFPRELCLANVNNLYLEVLLDFTPGGVSLKKNQEMFVNFCIDFE
jgi:hypothetical protein